MSHTRVCNILSSLLPLDLLIKYEFEWIRYTREAAKIENNLSPYWCRSMYATAQLHLFFAYQSSDLVVIKSCFSDLLWGSLTHHPTKPTVTLEGVKWVPPSFSHTVNISQCSKETFLHPVPQCDLPLSSLRGSFPTKVWTSSKGKNLHNCCPCLGSQLISWILTSEPFKMSGTYTTLSGTG